MTWLKRLMALLVILMLFGTAGMYGVLSLSLPSLDGKVHSNAITDNITLERDSLGQAIIHAKNRQDASYALGFAHGQDRFFQMDLLRRNAAGELSELFGQGALELDKRMRFHQFRQRAIDIVKHLPDSQQSVLKSYAKGVNDGRLQASFSSFEYLLSGAKIKPWQAEDSVLVIFSMYLDLQSATFERDKSLILLNDHFGPEMRQFLLQPSQYQAALDGSKLLTNTISIPDLKTQMTSHFSTISIPDAPIYGSNNWAVTGAHTKTGLAMLSDDMHLGLAVPAIWYKAQLNYNHGTQPQQITGVSLPGTPAIVVGSNDSIAWGFTNGYLDTADWIELNEQSRTWQVQENIMLPEGGSHQHVITMSDYGPVSQFNGKSYALSWVAHQPYAINLNLVELERAKEVDEAVNLADKIGIPVQNMVVVDSKGSAAWRPTGALPARKTPVDIALPVNAYSDLWHTNEEKRPTYKNPKHGKIWTGNSRVVSAKEHLRFGDGGYALGARSMQIRDRLFAKNTFTEQDFNELQLDNEARFLSPWHTHLTQLLSSEQQLLSQYEKDLTYLKNWQGCACEDSVGYTLVKYFRQSLINRIFAPLEHALNGSGSSLKSLKRYLEPALWQLIKEKPNSWLVSDPSWQQLQITAYEQAKKQLAASYSSNMNQWQWGAVNALEITHPFSKQLPVLSTLLDMPKVSAFGDTFMPAVQRAHFGASQRFIAQPGKLENAVMTVAGGQSEHPLSPYYRAGFNAYADGKLTPLLPGNTVHRLEFMAIKK